MRTIATVMLLALAPLALADPTPPQAADQPPAPSASPLTLRHLEIDLRTPDQQGLTYQTPDPTPPIDPAPIPLARKAPIYLVGPGFRARVDAVEFRVVPDDDQSSNLNSGNGKLVLVIPANTVFDLTPVAQRFAPRRIWVRTPPPIAKGDGPAATPPAAQPVCGQISGRVAGQIDGRVTGPGH
jgi:hypothetical protein